MNRRAWLAAAVLALAGCASTGGSSDAVQRRDKLRAMHTEALKDFYASNPKIQAELEAAVGYAVFDASQVNIVLYLGAAGAGVMVDNRDKTETFMSMTRAGTGPGVGYKSYRQLLVFKDKTVFDTFRTVGADVGASADATFKRSGSSGGVSLDGSSSFNPSLSVYQITDSGALLQANWGGVAYLPDDELNKLK
jgi:lipid-binding SYLF domain-containing protein